MAKNIKISEYTGQFINPAVQLNTSVSQIMQESIDLPQNDQLLFTSDLEKDYKPLGDCEPFQVFKVDDPLTYRKFDPKAIKAAKELDAIQQQSADNAEKINPVMNR